MAPNLGSNGDTISWDVKEGEALVMTNEQADCIYKWMITASDRAYDPNREIQPWYKLNGIRDFTKCTDLTPVETFFSSIVSSCDTSCIAIDPQSKVAFAINSIKKRPPTKTCIDMFLKWRMFKKCYGRNASPKAIREDMIPGIVIDMTLFFADYWKIIQESMKAMGKRFYMFNLGIEHYIHEVSFQSKMNCACVDHCPCCLDDAPRSDLDGLTVSSQFNFLMRLYAENNNAPVSDDEEKKEEAFVLKIEVPAQDKDRPSLIGGTPKQTTRRELQMPEPSLPVASHVSKESRKSSCSWILKSTPTKRLKSSEVISVSPIVKNYIDEEIDQVNRETDNLHRDLDNRVREIEQMALPDLTTRVEDLESEVKEHSYALENLDQSDLQQKLEELEKTVEAQQDQLHDCVKYTQELEAQITSLRAEGLTLIDLQSQVQDLRDLVALLTTFANEAVRSKQ